LFLPWRTHTPRARACLYRPRIIRAMHKIDRSIHHMGRRTCRGRPAGQDGLAARRGPVADSGERILDGDADVGGSSALPSQSAQSQNANVHLTWRDRLRARDTDRSALSWRVHRRWLLKLVLNPSCLNLQTVWPREAKLNQSHISMAYRSRRAGTHWGRRSRVVVVHAEPHVVKVN
jgi:hypothetical protein